MVTINREKGILVTLTSSFLVFIQIMCGALYSGMKTGTQIILEIEVLSVKYFRTF